MTIDEIKEYCIAIDLANIEEGDSSIGTMIDGKFVQFNNEKELRVFYAQIGLKSLLSIFSAYNGLECLQADGESLEKHGYVVDILSLLDYMK